MIMMFTYSVLFIQGACTTTPNWDPGFIPSQLDNMNGHYPFSATPGGKSNMLPERYRDYPGGVESFDVYSPPMTTLYSQVWWKPLPPVDLPADIIKKYSGKGMAIVGWEIDQVRRTANGDVSVPISASYNHHYGSTIIGAGVRFRKVVLDGPNDPHLKDTAKHEAGCGKLPWDQPRYIVEGPELSPRGLPTRQGIQSGNGGEYRKTYHGFAPGHAVVVDSPTSIQITPMQIDTWNRDEMNISGPLPPKFVPGPEPRASLAPRDGAMHSGLLECPMTTRLAKVVDTATYVTVSEGMCEEPIATFQECFQAAAVLLGANTVHWNETGKDSSRPAGCSAINAGGTGVGVFFNDVALAAACSAEARCVCPRDPTPFGQARGALLYQPTNQSADVGAGKAAYFDRKCAAWPATNLLDQKNPTCDIRYYRGGQWACNHMWSLLDADQEIPWTDRPLTFHHKYRFWVQPYRAQYHARLSLGESVGSALLVGSPWEYDVPKCAKGIPGCELVDGTWIHTISGSMMGRHVFVTLNNHCHAPTCLSTSVYACSRGTALSDCNSSTGKLVCETRPIYGGTGHPDISGTRFDEPGYIAIPDCMWGSSEYGLEAPPDLDGVPLHVVKRANATDGHYGEMSGGQPWVLLHERAEVLV